MIAFFLLLVIVAIALGIVGVVVKGLLYLLFIEIVVFLVGFHRRCGDPATEPPRPVIRHQALIPPDTVQDRSAAT